MCFRFDHIPSAPYTLLSMLGEYYVLLILQIWLAIWLANILILQKHSNELIKLFYFLLLWGFPRSYIFKHYIFLNKFYSDIILLKVEPDLFKHLANHGVRAINFAWDWMSNGFQTVTFNFFKRKYEKNFFWRHFKNYSNWIRYR
jgi:hypothetical protein